MNATKVLIFFSFSLLSACGFQLRGGQTLPPAFHEIILQTNTPYSLDIRLLKEDLLARNILFTTHSKTALVLNVNSLPITRSESSPDPSTHLIAMTITSSLEFSLSTTKHKIIIPSTILKVSRSQTIDTNALIGSSHTTSHLEADMRRELITLLFDRLTANNTLKSLAS